LVSDVYSINPSEDRTLTIKKFNKEIKVQRKKSMTQKDTSPDIKTFTSIICMNTTEHIYNVFTQNGMLLNKVNYADKINIHGEPLATSSNGVNFVFKRSLSVIKENYLKLVLASNFTNNNKLDK